MRRAWLTALLMLGILLGTVIGYLVIHPSRGSTTFVGSIDTMKLSKDQASGGFTSGDAQAVDLAASTAASHISVVTALDYPTTMGGWANRVHSDGKSVWFRLNVVNGNVAHGDLNDGSPNFAPGFLTTLHNLMLAHPSFFQSGDILDGDAEAENSVWWVNHYQCGVQSSCTPCNTSGSNIPCAPVWQFNDFYQHMTIQENADLASLAISGVNTRVHSTDPGTGTHQLSNATVQMMGNMITVDAYPDQNITDPAQAASAWCSNLASWHQAWLNRGIDVTIMVGEWGYSNTINVSDSQQQAVLHAETTSCFPTVPYLIGMNYWVGPGWNGAGGYTYIFSNASGSWKLRPGAIEVSNFFNAMIGPPPTPTPTPTLSGTAPVNTTKPVITGSAVQGSTVNGSTGTWSGTQPISYTYRWQRCDTAGAHCSKIAQATATTYTVQAADVGFTLRFKVNAKNTVGSASARSTPTATVTTVPVVLTAAVFQWLLSGAVCHMTGMGD